MGRFAPSVSSRPLPDYLRPGLDLVFVGLNPGRYSAEVGHYFARPQNRFWSALSASGLVPHPVGPDDDASLLDRGIGFTDVVRRPTGGIDELARDEFKAGAKTLRQKLLRYQPRVVCFVGLTGYQMCFEAPPTVGLQTERLGHSRIFVIPSTSPRNTRYSLNDITRALRELRRALDDSRQNDSRMC